MSALLAHAKAGFDAFSRSLAFTIKSGEVHAAYRRFFFHFATVYLAMVVLSVLSGWVMVAVVPALLIIFVFPPLGLLYILLVCLYFWRLGLGGLFRNVVALSSLSFVLCSVIFPIGTNTFFLIGLQRAAPEQYERHKGNRGRGLLKLAMHALAMLVITVVVAKTLDVVELLASPLHAAGLPVAFVFDWLRFFQRAHALGMSLVSKWHLDFAGLGFRQHCWACMRYAFILIGFASPFIVLLRFPLLGTLLSMGSGYACSAFLVPLISP
mmetsp:Transcript_5100/g.11238  ORF Transcript_5100/g.11238 Transcript_5100/m.11238 type:complete len:267 (-) Transcript_5100:305-1105(-)